MQIATVPLGASVRQRENLEMSRTLFGFPLTAHCDIGIAAACNASLLNVERSNCYNCNVSCNCLVLIAKASSQCSLYTAMMHILYLCLFFCK
jgi:hypothetical protein